MTGVYSPSFSARAHFSRVAVPFLQALAHQTGMRCMTLLAGEPPETEGGEYRYMAVHVGESADPVPQNLSTYDPMGYTENIIAQFIKFVQSTSRTSR